jgi:hypothetical protein
VQEIEAPVREGDRQTITAVAGDDANELLTRH